MKERSARGVGAVILLVFVVFLVYQIWNGLSDKITTIDAASVTVEEIISVEGTFIRDQAIISGNPDNAEFLVSNGEKVAVNQGVCIYFKNEEASKNYKRLKEIEAEIEAIEYIDSYVSSGTDGAKFDSMVYSYLNELLSYADSGKLDQTQKSYTALKQLVIARDAGLYSKSIFKEKLEELKSQKVYYENLLDEESATIVSPYSGYFFTKADGYEEYFSTKCLDNITSQYLIAAQDAVGLVSDDVIGSVVNSFYWYIAAEISSEQATKLYGKSSIDAYIPNISSTANNYTVEKIIRESSEKCILILKSSIMSSDYLGSRFQPVDIVLGVYTGIKVPTEALHQKNGEWGVYCLEGASEKFKKAKIIYQTDSYYLLEMAESASKGLYIYDKIIVGGTSFAK